MEYDELSLICYKYGSDKCPQILHSYTPYYYDLFKDMRQDVKKVAEMGIGYWEMMKYSDEYVVDPGLNNRKYVKGASLKMWRDFFPNAHIYGGDKKREVLFEDERITTIHCDERRERDLRHFIKKSGSDIDIFIDDASHDPVKQIFMCKTLMPMLDKDVIYIIEDVMSYTVERITSSLQADYQLEYPHLQPQIIKPHKTGRLVIVRHK